MKNRKTKGVLWIGFGNFARRIYKYVEQRPDTEITSFFYPNKARAVERFGSLASWKINTAVTDPSVTAVFITTPNDRHTSYIELGLKNNKHVFVEKPITARLDEALSLKKLADQKKVCLMVGHNMRRQAAIRKMRNIIDSGKIGKVVSVYANYSKGIAQSMNPESWRYRIKRHREGPLITVGIHLIDVFHYLLGPASSVSATIKNVSKKTEAPDSNAVLINFESEATAFLETNYNTPSESVLNIYGTEGTLYLTGDKLSCRLGRDKNRVPSPAKLIRLVKVDDFKEEIDEFFGAIDGRVKIETGYDVALNALIVVEACFQSSRKKKTIRIRDISEYYFKNKRDPLRNKGVKNTRGRKK